MKNQKPKVNPKEGDVINAKESGAYNINILK